MTKFGTTREGLIRELQNEPQVTCISTDAKHVSVLSYTKETDGWYCFYRVRASEADQVHCINYSLFDKVGSYQVKYSKEKFRQVTGGDTDRYSGVVFRYGDILIAADPQTPSFKSLKKLTGVFFGTIADEFRNMHIASKLIDMEDNLVVYYDTECFANGILRPMGFAPCCAAETADKEDPRIWKAVEKNIRSVYGEAESRRLLEECTAEDHGRIHIMTISPAELEVMHLSECGDDGTYGFLAINPCVCEMCFTLDRRFEFIRIKADTADKLGISRKALETEGFMLLLERDKMNPVIVRSSSGFVKNLCLVIGQKEKGRSTRMSLLQNIMLARAIGRTHGVFNVSVQETAIGNHVSFGIGINATRRKFCSVNFHVAYKKLEMALARRHFVLKWWRKDGSDYTVNFVLVDAEGKPVPVRAGRYTDVTAGIELQFSYDSSTANKLCGVFYRGNSVCYCGNILPQQDYGFSAVCAQKKTGTGDFTMLINEFFYGFPDGSGDASTPSAYRYLITQAGFMNGKKSVFEHLEIMPPKDETKEAFSAIWDEPSSDSPFQISRRIGKRQLRQAAGIVPGKDWSQLDTVMLLTEVSENNTAELFRKRLSMACIGEILADAR